MFKVSYQAPQFSVSHQAYVNHGAITRPKVFSIIKLDFLKTSFRTMLQKIATGLPVPRRRKTQRFDLPLKLGVRSQKSILPGPIWRKNEQRMAHKNNNQIMSTHKSSIPISKLKEPLKVLYSKNGEKPLTNYSADFINGSVDARRSPIKPEQVQWTDRPKFEASSQYKVLTRQSLIFSQRKATHRFRSSRIS